MAKKTLKVKRIYKVENLGKILKAKRKRAGKTLDQIAQKVGITRQYLSLIENQNIRGELAESLLIAIEETLDNLLIEQSAEEKSKISQLISESKIAS